MRNEHLKYHLVLDIGNTSVKGGVFMQNKMIDFFQSSHENWELNWAIFEAKYAIDWRVFSNVSNLEPPLKADWIAFNPFKKEHWTITYQNPSTMGLDRIAAAMGARTISNAEKILVVDMGSCVTYTGLNRKEITGYGIAPGRNMRWLAMNEFTDKLPKIDPSSDISDYHEHGTEENLFFGGHVGWREEILSLSSLLKAQHDFNEVIFTGTDAVYLKDFLREDMSIVAHLNLIGMNNWLYEI